MPDIEIEPLVTKADGTKFGKTEGGSVWLSAEMTSPYAFYQFCLNAEDAKVGEYLRIFTFRSRDEIEELERATVERPQAREAQRVLAADVTDLVHGRGGPAAGGGGQPGPVRPGGPADPGRRSAGGRRRRAAGRAGAARAPPVVDLFTLSGLVASRSAARRVITEGGAYVNNRKVEQEEAVIEPARLRGRWALLRRGRRSLAAVEFTDDPR